MKECLELNADLVRVPMDRHRPQDDIPYEYMMKRIIEDYRHICAENVLLNARVTELKEDVERFSRLLRDSEANLFGQINMNRRLMHLLDNAYEKDR